MDPNSLYFASKRKKILSETGSPYCGVTLVDPELFVVITALALYNLQELLCSWYTFMRSCYLEIIVPDFLRIRIRGSVIQNYGSWSGRQINYGSGSYGYWVFDKNCIRIRIFLTAPDPQFKFTARSVFRMPVNNGSTGSGTLPES